MSDVDPDKYDHVWRGKYQKNSERRVFKNWKVEEFDTPLDAVLRFGADWGFSVDPTVLVRMFIGRWQDGKAVSDPTGRVLFIDHEAYKVGCEIDETPSLFAGTDKEDPPRWANNHNHPGIPGAKKWLITADSSRPETVSYMKRKGFRIAPAIKGPGSVEDGIEFLKTYDNRLASLADTVRDNPAGARLSVREVQDISAALRNAADGAFRSNAPADGPVLANLGKAVRDAGRNSSEGYRKWLGQYADDSDLLEAATTGRNFVSVSTDPVSARSTDAFVGRASGATPGELTVQRQAAGQAMQAAGSNPTTARGVLTNLAYDDDQYRRSASIGLDADRLKARAGAELRSVTQAQRASPRVGSETSTNAQDAGGAAGLSIGDLANPIRAAAGVALNRIRSRGFNDQEAQAIVEAVIDPARTQEVIGFLAQRMTRREARNLQRVIRKQVTTGLLSGQQPSA